ncbi:hypothetical protein I6F21_29370 [Bradyrhizobium sp. NBAIM03]|uniref:hypothetical protein n=1 Tax=Bradyrhizobium sp. NBAIM03 TaxID=2793816 RepID=UPI001CD25069|nr:hypothetical protein [Bradyrhizobium sp. NBAIM03]MCA1536640.1 hypothetical protein [Bradyrhizobium sp. NBAIM03]
MDLSFPFGLWPSTKRFLTGEGGDRWELHRREIANWFERNNHLIQPCDEGHEYLEAMEAWRLTGMPMELKPSWKGEGERSILEVLNSVEEVVAEGEVVIAIIDDRKARAVIKTLEDVDIDLMATETYLEWLVKRFGIKEAAAAWTTIKTTTDKKASDAPRPGCCPYSQNQMMAGEGVISTAS